jgi:hypothetical protein
VYHIKPDTIQDRLQLHPCYPTHRIFQDLLSRMQDYPHSRLMIDKIIARALLQWEIFGACASSSQGARLRRSSIPVLSYSTPLSDRAPDARTRLLIKVPDPGFPSSISPFSWASWSNMYPRKLVTATPICFHFAGRNGSRNAVAGRTKITRIFLSTIAKESL